MKKLFFAAALVASILIQPAFAQLSPLLDNYYGIKNALVSDDTKAAAGKAVDLLKAIDAVDMKSLPAKDHTAFMAVKDKLIFDAKNISGASDIELQRNHFTSLSSNMATLAKQTTLSQQPIYQEFCPMKKAYWLSNETAIKNPYYGSSMLTCGKVTATLKP